MGQTCMRINTGGPTMPAGQWRSRIEAALGVARDDPAWLSVAVVPTGTALWLVPHSPEADSFVGDRFGALAKAIVVALGRATPVEAIERALTVRRSPYPVEYVIPKLVVAKKERDWAIFKPDNLDEGARTRIANRISADIAGACETWGIPRPDPLDPPAVRIVEVGRPMPIRDAVVADRSGHGAGVAVLARLGVKFACNLRLEGEWAFGQLKALGFGRAFRELVMSELWRPEIDGALLKESA